MLPKNHRFNLRKERGFFSKAKRLHTQNLSFFLLQTPDQQRASVIVTKKASLLATKRNALKRVIREALLQEFKKHSFCFYNIVVVLKKTITPTTVLQVKEDIRTTFSKLCAVK